MRQLTGTLLLALAFFLCGCTPWATYPPIEDISNPALAPIPTLMAEAVRYVHEQDDGEGEVVLNLPEDTPAKVYDKVLEKLGAGRPMETGDRQAYHVEAVRVRAVDAEVDLIHPGNGGAPELMTIYFQQQFLDGWRVKWHRRWRIRIEAPEVRYVPLPPEEEEPQPQAEPEAGAATDPRPDAVSRPT
jgi:hypothetical protein